MGLGSSRNRMELEEFQSDPDSNFISIHVADSDEEAQSHRHVTGGATPIVPCPSLDLPTDETSDPLVCPICLTNTKDLTFGCGHLTCRNCGSKLSICPICREPITSRQRVYI